MGGWFLLRLLSEFLTSVFVERKKTGTLLPMLIFDQVAKKKCTDLKTFQVAGRQEGLTRETQCIMLTTLIARVV